MEPGHRLKARRCATLAGVAAACLIATGCVGTAPVRAAESPILCEASYSNFAWVPTLVFTGIGEDGRIYRFDSRENQDLQGFALLDLALPERPRATDIARRYVISSPTGAVVPPDVLRRIRELAEAARDGRVSRQQRGADMGQSTLACFVVSTGGNLLDTVLVRSDGDWEERNSDPAAAELADLLTALLVAPPAQ